MSEIINLSGVVGYDITAEKLAEKLKSFKGRSIRFDINSPGGSVFDGLEIYNLIKNYEGETETRIVSLGASMGSIIALAGKKRTAEDTAVYMIHNASGISWGDYRDMEKTAELLKSLSSHLANIYSTKTGIGKKEIQKMMDEESWFFGSELEKFGFEIIETKNEKDKETYQAVAKLDFENCIEKMKNYKEPTEKISAILKQVQMVSTPLAAEGKNIKQEVIEMDKTKLKAEFPELYAEILAEGKNQEKDRLSKLDAYADINSDVNAVIAKAKAEGKTVDEVMPQILKASQTTQEAVNAQAENAPAISGVSDENANSDDQVNKLLAMAKGV